jgi:two-component system sensor histidine kinase HydH
MRLRFGIRVQTLLVVVLFLGSVVALLVNGVALLALPRREEQARTELLDVSRRLAEAAAPLKIQASTPFAELDRRLAALTEKVLADAPNVEGGFYLGADNRFAGYAYPTNPHPLPPGGAGSTPRNDPPPLEAPYIRIQARQSLDTSSTEVQARDVGPSRVLVVTAPVGQERPPPLAVWAMLRLVGPETKYAQLRRYQISTGLALGGILLALGLTANLGRSLQLERKEQERLRDELRRSEHLAGLGRLLAGVAHEVRNPLAGIRSTVQLWQRLPDQARTPESLEAVLAAVDRLNGLISRLLFFARAGQAERVRVDLNALVRETAALLQAQAQEQGVRCELLLQPGLPVTLGTPSALQQVILNLASNALQAMPHGGVLRLQTQHAATWPWVELRVADTGPGVTPEARAHLFEPFFTTRPEGTGLGLALCREIVTQHGGTVGLESGEGPGAVFRVQLPIERGIKP